MEVSAPALPHAALNFHGLGTPHSSVEADERPFWLSFDAFERILDQMDADPAPDRFMVTFDDGNHSDVEAADRLRRRGRTGRFYVLAGRIGTPGYLSTADLKGLAANNAVVGLHGRSHVDWRLVDDQPLADETIAARGEIAAATGHPVEEVAIPFGAYDSRVFAWLERQGFRHIVTSDRGTFDPAARVWNRNTVMADMDADAIDAILKPGRHPFAQIKMAASQAYRRRFR
jgi:peptidoglycan/xylan/chitin deacetylase (PgdA/CDA1 family)